MGDLAVVAGAGGFIGGHLVRRLRELGRTVRAIDLQPLEHWQQRFEDVENLVLDLREAAACRAAARDAREIYNLAADMGGMGYIESHKALCMLSVLINTNLLVAARDGGAERFFFASSACVYPIDKQNEPSAAGLREEDAYPAMPEDGYGWEKLFGERMCRHFREDFGIETRVARYHNVYGPYGTWTGGREKAPAAIARKVAEAKLSGDPRIEIWGDGRQTRSFTFVDDCVAGTLALMRGDVADPLNVGSSECVTIDGLVDVVEEIAGLRLERRYRPEAPQGVRGRNSDNTNIRAAFGWEPSISLRAGMEPTYAWVLDQVRASREG